MDLGGLTVWEVLLARIARITSRIHVVLSPEGAEAVRDARLGPPKGVTLTTSIQPRPTGMGDAVFGSLTHWDDARHVMLVWGDQLGLGEQTLARTAERQRRARRPTLTLPLVRTSRPYVDYRFDRRGRLVDVLQTREGDVARARGWSDVGLFALPTAGLGGAWSRFVAATPVGAQTGERNFLPFLPWLSRVEGLAVSRFRVDDPAEARGLNTPEDLAWFRARLGSGP
jgi:bifunctional UDP-N-acetylglucosamine pyrophosphorylase/glucosamine-1-phosphate N-acetyltransferase